MHVNIRIRWIYHPRVVSERMEEYGAARTQTLGEWQWRALNFVLDDSND